MFFFFKIRMLIRNHHYRSSSNELIKICINNQDLKDNEQINYYVNIISSRSRLEFLFLFTCNLEC